MRLSEASDEELLRLGADAFGEFYTRNERFVLAYFMRRGCDAELASDLAATTFLEALRSRERFRPGDAGDAGRWLFGIASHVMSRHWRKNSADNRRDRKLRNELPTLADTQLKEIEQLSEDAPLMAALAQLPAAQREAIFSYVVAGLSYEEIAEATEANPIAIRKRVSRGLAALRAGQRGPR